MTDNKITQEELVQIFGLTMPWDAVTLLMEPGDRTPDEVRAALRAVARKRPARGTLTDAKERPPV